MTCFKQTNKLCFTVWHPVSFSSSVNFFTFFSHFLVVWWYSCQGCLSAPLSAAVQEELQRSPAKSAALLTVGEVDEQISPQKCGAERENILLGLMPYRVNSCWVGEGKNICISVMDSLGGYPCSLCFGAKSTQNAWPLGLGQSWSKQVGQKGIWCLIFHSVLVSVLSAKLYKSRDRSHGDTGCWYRHSANTWGRSALPAKQPHAASALQVHCVNGILLVQLNLPCLEKGDVRTCFVCLEERKREKREKKKRRW